MQWFIINDINQTDTPALAVYQDRVQQNIDLLLEQMPDTGRLRPHVKSNKIPEVCKMMMDAGISKFKCATVAEAEMLGNTGAKDVLMAYQPVGPKALRLLELVRRFPATTFSCLVDNIDASEKLSAIFSEAGILLNVFIDINNGMNRTGIEPADASSFLNALVDLPSLKVRGVHIYDGHITTADKTVREQQSDEAFDKVRSFLEYFSEKMNAAPIIVAGGSATFSAHIKRNVECSPGTFIFWDWGYKQKYTEEPFDYAALVITRVISIVNDTLITTDLGYKSVASEGPLPRVHFLNAAEATPVSQSEEHLSLQVPDSAHYKIGEVLYGVPDHICPSVALYDQAIIVRNNQSVGHWKVTAREKKY